MFCKGIYLLGDSIAESASALHVLKGAFGDSWSAVCEFKQMISVRLLLEPRSSSADADLSLGLLRHLAGGIPRLCHSLSQHHCWE